MSFTEWEAAQDPEKIFEWGQTSAEVKSLIDCLKKPFKELPHTTRWYFYSDYIQVSVGEKNELLQTTKDI